MTTNIENQANQVNKVNQANQVNKVNLVNIVNLVNETKKHKILKFWKTAYPKKSDIYKVAYFYGWHNTDNIYINDDLNNLYKINIINNLVASITPIEKTGYDELLQDYINILTIYDLEQPTLEELTELTEEDIEFNISYIEKNYNRIKGDQYLELEYIENLDNMYNNFPDWDENYVDTISSKKFEKN